MKQNLSLLLSSRRVAGLAAASLCAALVGCNQRSSTSSTEGTPVSARTNATRDVDNTAMNARDRNPAVLKPEDQSNSPADLETTARIRKAIVSSNDFSVVAKNVKIITVNGKVTLRGPVTTQAEKSGIVAIAESVAGATNVEDQLAVKANP